MLQDTQMTKNLDQVTGRSKSCSYHFYCSRCFEMASKELNRCIKISWWHKAVSQRIAFSWNFVSPDFIDDKWRNMWRSRRKEKPRRNIARIKLDAAFNCFNTCITWVEQHGVSARDIIILRNLREKVFEQEQVAKNTDLN